jgi:tetratricopeptide (TPR) repeat protein
MKLGKAAHTLFNGLRATVLGVTAAVVVQQAAVLMAADWLSGTTRHAVSKWGAGEASFTNEQWDSARQDLTQAVALTPNDATLHDALAQLHAAKGRSLWTTGAEDSPEVEAYLAAEQHQEASIKLRPTHAMAWANLALIRLAVYAEPEALYQAWREAARLGPKELAVENTLVTIATETWSTAPTDVRQWVESRRPGISEKQEARQNKSGGL